MGLSVVLRAPGSVKAQEIVHQPLEVPGGGACRVCWFREKSVAKGALSLWHNATLAERRQARPHAGQRSRNLQA